MLEKNFIFVFVLLIIFAVYKSNVIAESNPQSPLPEAEKIGENLYRIGRITLDMDKREAVIRGWVNMNEGFIEYLACCAGGKLHESLLILDVKPIHLQIALILLGLEPGGGIEYQGDHKIPKGDPVEVWVEWKEGDETKSVRAERMILNIKNGEPMQETQWIFTGSAIYNGKFIAEIERSLIATYRDPAAIINNPMPESTDDEIYHVNSKIVPNRGTSVTVTIKAVSELKPILTSDSSNYITDYVSKEENIILQEGFDDGKLNETEWIITREGDFKQFAVDVKNVSSVKQGDHRLSIMANTLETTDSIKYVGVRSVRKIDFSKPVEIAFDLDWNNQENGCYLTAGLYICPYESQNPKKEKSWLGFEWTGVPPGRNIRNSLWASVDGALKEIYSDWGPDNQGWPVKIGSYRIKMLLDNKSIRIWTDSKLLCYALHSLNFTSGYIFLQVSSGTNYPLREVYFDNIVVTSND